MGAFGIKFKLMRLIEIIQGTVKTEKTESPRTEL